MESHREINQVSLTVRGAVDWLAIRRMGNAQDLFAQPSRVSDAQVQSSSKDTGFVFAFGMLRVKAVVAQLGNVHDSARCVWQFHPVQ